jgi:hypothetical protein
MKHNKAALMGTIPYIHKVFALPKRLTILHILAVCGLFFAPTVRAQDSLSAWKISGVFGVTVTNVGLSNWAAGGQNTFAIGGLLAMMANYKFDGITWDNAIESAYGFARVGNDALRKSDDRLIYISKFTRKLKFIVPFGASALLDFRTQFTSGFDYNKRRPDGEPTVISRLFAPAYLNIATGLDYKPDDSFALFLSPIGGRGIIVTDTALANQGSFGVEQGKTSKFDMGATMNMFYKTTVMENVTFQTRLNLFSAYHKLSSVVVNWETLTTMSVNKFIKVSFDTQLIYDERVMISRDNGTVGPATQFRNTLAIGFVLPI